jgi:hypothetical protein
MRRVEQLERMVDTLRFELARQRSDISSGLSPSQTQILQPIDAVNPRNASGSNYTINYERAKIWDLEVRNLTATGGNLTMKVVTDGTTPRYALLANTWSQEIAQDAFVLAAPYKGIYLPISEECGE